MDKVLIQKSLKGDRKAFEKLYYQHRDQVYGVLAQRLWDRDTLDDLVQNTFFRAFKSLHTFKGDALFSTWLTQIALNVYRSNLRSVQSRQNWLQTSEDPEAVSGVLRDFDKMDDPARLVQDKERAELVRQSIEKLPERYRKAMWYRYVLDWSYEEIRHGSKRG